MLSSSFQCCKSLFFCCFSFLYVAANSNNNFFLSNEYLLGLIIGIWGFRYLLDWSTHYNGFHTLSLSVKKKSFCSIWCALYYDNVMVRFFVTLTSFHTIKIFLALTMFNIQNNTSMLNYLFNALMSVVVV